MDLSVCPCSISPGYVVLIGMGVVFVGLFVLVLVTGAMGLIFKGGREKTNKAAAPDETVAPVSSVQIDIMNTAERQQVIAAVSAAIAAYTGAKDMSGLRIRSIRRI